MIFFEGNWYKSWRKIENSLIFKVQEIKKELMKKDSNRKTSLIVKVMKKDLKWFKLMKYFLNKLSRNWREQDRICYYYNRSILYL